jgi:hypothetical protein
LLGFADFASAFVLGHQKLRGSVLRDCAADSPSEPRTPRYSSCPGGCP